MFQVGYQRSIEDQSWCSKSHALGSLAPAARTNPGKRPRIGRKRKLQCKVHIFVILARAITNIGGKRIGRVIRRATYCTTCFRYRSCQCKIRSEEQN